LIRGAAQSQTNTGSGERIKVDADLGESKVNEKKEDKQWYPSEDFFVDENHDSERSCAIRSTGREENPKGCSEENTERGQT
jgi:hypothetical protein